MGTNISDPLIRIAILNEAYTRLEATGILKPIGETAVTPENTQLILKALKRVQNDVIARQDGKPYTSVNQAIEGAIIDILRLRRQLEACNSEIETYAEYAAEKALGPDDEALFDGLKHEHWVLLNHIPEAERALDVLLLCLQHHNLEIS